MNFLLELNKNDNQKEIDIQIEKTKQINMIEKTRQIDLIESTIKIDKSIEYVKTCHLLFNNNNDNLRACIDKILN